LLVVAALGLDLKGQLLSRLAMGEEFVGATIVEEAVRGPTADSIGWLRVRRRYCSATMAVHQLEHRAGANDAVAAGASFAGNAPLLGIAACTKEEQSMAIERVPVCTPPARRKAGRIC
jgi:hypothetical protein